MAEWQTRGSQKAMSQKLVRVQLPLSAQKLQESIRAPNYCNGHTKYNRQFPVVAVLVLPSIYNMFPESFPLLHIWNPGGFSQDQTFQSEIILPQLKFVSRKTRNFNWIPKRWNSTFSRTRDSGGRQKISSSISLSFNLWLLISLFDLKHLFRQFEFFNYRLV